MFVGEEFDFAEKLRHREQVHSSYGFQSSRTQLQFSLVSPSNSHEWVCKQVSKFSHRASKPELAVLVYEGKFGKNGFDNHIIRSG